MKRIALALVFACCTAAAPQAAPQDNTEEERLYFRMNVPAPQFVNVLRADEVDVNLASGEILVARENIEIAIEAP